MSRRAWWLGLLGVGLALIGVWGAWAPHRAAGLVLSGWDLAEFVKFVPGATVPRELFYLPVWCGAVVLGLLASQRVSESASRRIPNPQSHSRQAPGTAPRMRGRWGRKQPASLQGLAPPNPQIPALSLHRLALLVIALGLTVALLPPYPDVFKAYQSTEFRWQFIFGVSGGLAVVVSPFSRRWPTRLIGGLMVALALLGAIPALWQFLQVRNEIEVVYGAPLGWGWGLGAFLVGWGLVGTIGGWMLLKKPDRSSKTRQV